MVAFETGMAVELQNEVANTRIGLWLLRFVPEKWKAEGRELGKLVHVPFLSKIASCIYCSTFWINMLALSIGSLFTEINSFDFLTICILTLFSQKIFDIYEKIL